MFIILGKFHEEFLHAAVSVWCVLCLREAEGTREQEHHLDRGVCGPATQGKDWQLHSHFLNNQGWTIRITVSCLSAVKGRTFSWKWNYSKDYCVFIDLINILAVIWCRKKIDDIFTTSLLWHKRLQPISWMMSLCFWLMQ